MNKFQIIASAATLLLAMTGCASNSGSPSSRGNLVRVEYARISDMRRVEMPSAAPAGAVVGGFTGLILSSGRSTRSQVASGVGGAVLGAVAASALEDRRGYEYTLRYNNNNTSRFTTDKGFLRRGDCVAVESGQYANLRRVSSTFCTAGIVSEPDPEHVRLASQCNDAKNQLLAAASDEEVDLATRKITILCQDLD